MNHIGTIQLETERLILRRFTEEDADQMFRNWASDDEVTKFLTWPTHKNVFMSLGYINFCISGYEELSFYQWGVELKETHELIGNISVVKVMEELERLELGYAIGRKYWGNGYTAEAAEKIIEVLFTEVGAKSIAARHDVSNPNSGRVMQKIGMKYEGTLRQSDLNNQGIVDTSYYSILKSEWTH